jgi:hypothetical protein
MIHIELKTTWRSIIIGGIFLLIVCCVAAAFVITSSNKTGYFAEEQKDFNSYSWEELANISSNMTVAGNMEGALREAAKYGFTNEDGSLRTDLEKEITLADGTQAKARLVALHTDTRTNGSGKAGMTFVITVPLDSAAMNIEPTNEGGWENSNLRETLANIYVSQLPEDLQTYLVAVRKQTNNTGQTSSSDAVTITDDKLWLLSSVEVMGESSGSESFVLNAEGSQYSAFADSEIRQEILQEIAESSSGNWWLRSACSTSQSQFLSIAGSEQENAPEAEDATNALSVVVGFCI